VTTWLSSLLALSGCCLILVAGIGLVRLPDLLCRCHAVAKALTLGTVLLLISAWLPLDGEDVGTEFFLAILFQLGTIPVAGHLVALVAYQKNIPLWKPPVLTNRETSGCREEHLINKDNHHRV